MLNFNNYTLALLAIVLFTISSACSIKNNRINAPTNKLVIEKKQTKSNNSYTLFYLGTNKLDFLLTRPQKSDTNIVFCIPAAFTDLNDYFIDGLVVENEKIYNRNKINYTLKGALKITNGTCEILSTNNKNIFNDSLINIINSKKGSLFQQVLLLKDGEIQNFNDIKNFQRRAVVIFNDDKIAIIESHEHITLKEFANDLIELEIKNALYTDMGSWDEGWYRNSENVTIALGQMKTHTDKQSNWLIYKIK